MARMYREKKMNVAMCRAVDPVDVRQCVVYLLANDSGSNGLTTVTASSVTALTTT